MHRWCHGVDLSKSSGMTCAGLEEWCEFLFRQIANSKTGIREWKINFAIILPWRERKKNFVTLPTNERIAIHVWNPQLTLLLCFLLAAFNETPSELRNPRSIAVGCITPNGNGSYSCVGSSKTETHSRARVIAVNRNYLTSHPNMTFIIKFNSSRNGWRSFQLWGKWLHSGREIAHSSRLAKIGARTVSRGRRDLVLRFGAKLETCLVLRRRPCLWSAAAPNSLTFVLCIFMSHQRFHSRNTFVNVGRMNGRAETKETKNCFISE